ncbi:MAG: alpha-L-rhamnosidase, partial [Clostridia bacterium]|nr:alpha-L-rhamnosidase [Clostridia bacterium]
SWNLIDWPENLRDDYDFPATKPIGPGAHNVMNAFWYGMQCDMEKIRAELGLPADSSAAERTAKAFVNEFYDAEQKLFTDAKATKHTSTHSNLLPLFFGLDRFAGEGCRPVSGGFIRRKGVGCSGVSMSYFRLAGLKKAGEDEAVDELLHSPAGWLNMLREGATTTYEAWGRDQKWNTSLFHPWATAPILIMADKNLHP